MPTIIENCPRCNAQSMTFDVVADVWVGMEHNWVQRFEICAVCRRCKRPSLLLIRLSNPRVKDMFVSTGSVTKSNGDLEPTFQSLGFLSVADVTAKPSPEYLPNDVQAAFTEGAACLAVNCPNAASAMFRLCLDLVTKGLLPPLEDAEGPSRHERRNLNPRLKWLFDNQKLPEGLRDLSLAVKDHGDEGAHDGSLTAHEAEDIYDFAFALLESLFTVPARIDAARRRREERRGEAG
jgi:hypothetical protein